MVLYHRLQKYSEKEEKRDEQTHFDNVMNKFSNLNDSWRQSEISYGILITVKEEKRLYFMAAGRQCRDRVITGNGLDGWHHLQRLSIIL